VLVKRRVDGIRPFYGEVNFKAWAQELVKIIANAGIVFGSMFRSIDPNVLLTRAAYLERLNSWENKFFGSPDVWEQKK
jgi:hypothetical protein